MMELLLKDLRIQKLYLIKDNKINLSKSGLPFLDRYAYSFASTGTSEGISLAP